MKGLIVKSPWCGMILEGTKTMELRGSRTHIRGEIGIIQSKTGTIMGTTNLIDCIELTDEAFVTEYQRHRYTGTRSEIGYRKLYGWIFEGSHPYPAPVPYHHKQGSVIWVNLVVDFEYM